MLTYTNGWTKEKESYDPETSGYWVVRLRDGVGRILLDHDKQSHLSLSMGDCGHPKNSLIAAQADLALTLAKWPQAKGKLAIYKVPCVFSTRDGHVFICGENQIPTNMRIEAESIAAQDFHLLEENYYKKYRGTQ